VTILCAKDSEFPVLEPYRTYRGWSLVLTLPTLGVTEGFGILAAPEPNRLDDGEVYNRGDLDRGMARI
jgi:hypothetical protein